jgi:tetratricopeptide (TPR) repeat protein
MKNKVFIFVLLVVLSVNFSVKAGQTGQKEVREAESYFEKSRASLENGDAHMAVKYAEKAIFLRNDVVKYLDYFNVYDSLAEAYTIKGETGQAIKCYERSLELNPRSNNYEIDVYKQGRRNLEDLKKRESDK